MGFLTPQAFGEQAVLKTYAMQQLAQLRTTVHGLTDEQANSTPTASALNLTALLLHCGPVAVYWSASCAAAPNAPRLPVDLADRPLEELVAERRSLVDTLAFFDRCVEEAATNMDAIRDLDVRVPVPEAPWIPDGLTSWQARWCLAHIASEVARHTGHADIIRESIDGKGSFELHDVAEVSL